MRPNRQFKGGQKYYFDTIPFLNTILIDITSMIIMKKKITLKTINLLLTILVVAIFIVIKSSSLPTLQILPDFGVTIFEKPHNDTISYEVFRIFENVSLAYIAAFIFYILVEYIPKRKASKTAFKILQSSFVNIYLNMSRIIYPLKMILELDKENCQIVVSELQSLKLYKPVYEKTYYRSITSLSDKRDNNNGEKGIFRFHMDLPKLANSITKEISEIIKLPLISNLDYKLVELISLIESCEFVKKCRRLSNSPLKNIDYTIHDFDISFYEFIQLYERLGIYKFRRISYDYNKLNTDEIIKMQKDQKKLFVKGQFDNSRFYHNSIEYIIENGELIQ